MYDNDYVPGRNDPCWCGSGKKYKKCHARMDEHLDRLASAGEEVMPRGLLKTSAPRPSTSAFSTTSQRTSAPA